MKFYTDVHVPFEVVKQLRQKEVDIIHCVEVNMEDATDPEHLEYAIQNGYIMVSCDADFERLHTEYLKQGKEHTGIVYFRMKDQCQSIGTIVKAISFLVEAANYQTDLYNQIWRTKNE